MKPIVVKELNIQIQEELYSAYLYQAIAAYAKSKSLDGFANWFDIQVKEEIDHARGFYNYILDRGGKVELLAIAKPPKDFKGVEVLFVESLKHEKHVTARIHGLYALAEKENDISLKSFLKWYIDEQVEEEANASMYIDKVKMAGSQGLLLIDQELATRTYTQASILGPTVTA